MGTEQKHLSDYIIFSLIILLGVSEIIYLYALMKEWSYTQCTAIMQYVWIILLVILTVYGAIKSALLLRKARKIPKHKQPISYLVLVAIIGAIIILQLIRIILLQSPDITADQTLEMMKTFTYSDQLGQINPLTGTAYDVGIPLRLKILVLPVLYAGFADWIGISQAIILYDVIPSVVLLLCYVVYHKWAIFLYPDNQKRQLFFMLCIVVLIYFGDYNPYTPGSMLLYQGWRGETICLCLLLPYALLKLFQKQWIVAILCILAEACIVWTTYGAGIIVLQTTIFLVYLLVRTLLNKRRKSI